MIVPVPCYSDEVTRLLGATMDGHHGVHHSLVQSVQFSLTICTQEGEEVWLHLGGCLATNRKSILQTIRDCESIRDLFETKFSFHIKRVWTSCTDIYTCSWRWMGVRQLMPFRESYLVVRRSVNFRELLSSLIRCRERTIPCPRVTPPPMAGLSRILWENKINATFLA